MGSRANKIIRHSGGKAYKVGAGATESLLVAGYVTKPMISRPARMELLAGSVAGLVYDIATQSSGSSSERNGTHVGPGDTQPKGHSYPVSGYRLWASDNGRDLKAGTQGPCKHGYALKKVRGRWLCVKK